jgi:hypothetical protein
MPPDTGAPLGCWVCVCVCGVCVWCGCGLIEDINIEGFQGVGGLSEFKALPVAHGCHWGIVTRHPLTPPLTLRTPPLSHTLTRNAPHNVKCHT